VSGERLKGRLKCSTGFGHHWLQAFLVEYKALGAFRRLEAVLLVTRGIHDHAETSTTSQRTPSAV
jgi:hypothetical protein